MNVTSPSNTFVSRINQAKKIFQSAVKILETRAQTGRMKRSSWVSTGEGDGPSWLPRAGPATTLGMHGAAAEDKPVQGHSSCKARYTYIFMYIHKTSINTGIFFSHFMKYPVIIFLLLPYHLGV